MEGLHIRGPLTRSARKLLPKKVQRSLLLAYGANRPYAHFPGLASRHCLETAILPWMRDRCQSVLFVGTASYTWQYERQFAADRYTTLDIAAGVAVWGARRHIVAPLQELTCHRPSGFFDGVVLNGVLGFGIDTPEQMHRTFEELRRALAARGLLVVGWNTDRHEDPETLGLYAGFERSGERRVFPGETHVYDVLVSTRPAPPTSR